MYLTNVGPTEKLHGKLLLLLLMEFQLHDIEWLVIIKYINMIILIY